MEKKKKLSAAAARWHAGISTLKMQKRRRRGSRAVSRVAFGVTKRRRGGRGRQAERGRQESAGRETGAEPRRGGGSSAGLTATPPAQRCPSGRPSHPAPPLPLLLTSSPGCFKYHFLRAPGGSCAARGGAGLPAAPARNRPAPPRRPPPAADKGGGAGASPVPRPWRPLASLKPPCRHRSKLKV